MPACEAAKSCRPLALFCAAALLTACRSDALDQVQVRQDEQQQQIGHLEARLQMLETRPQLTFTLTENEIRIREKMLDPVVVASAQLAVSGDKMPSSFYVDVMLKVAVPTLQYEAVERQIFPVLEGRSALQMRQRLPQHGLKPEQVNVTLKPMAWYRGQAIDDERVVYQ